MAIDHKRKIIFIHIPKCGGTSVELALHDSSCVCRRNQWSKVPKGYGVPLNHLTYDQLINSDFLGLLYFGFEKNIIFE